MNYYKKLLSILLIMALVGSMLYLSTNRKATERLQRFDGKQTIYCWYTDESITDYISAMAVSFNYAYDVRVIPVYKSGLEYLEEINDVSIHTKAPVDLYILSNDKLEKAYLAGLAGEIDDYEDVININNYSQAAINAMTYNGKLIGYPLYFETSALLYNKTYMKDFIDKQVLRQELESENGYLDDEEGVTSSQEVMIDKVLTQGYDYKPETIDDILSVAKLYDIPEGLESIFKWDVSDIMHNYFLAGDAMKLGGVCSDNINELDIYNERSIEALEVYQQLHQFFSIDSGEANYEDVIQEFIEGKIFFTIATTDIISTMEEAIASEEFSYEYGISLLPDTSTALPSRSLSVTNGAIVNGYSENKHIANMFARYISYDNADIIYDMTGKISANKNVEYSNENVSKFLEEYSYSVTMPKLMSEANFWMEAEIAFKRIWDGEDVSSVLKVLSEHIMSQAIGEEYEEVYIEPAKEEAQEVEYIDEEAARNEAKSEDLENESGVE